MKKKFEWNDYFQLSMSFLGLVTGLLLVTYYVDLWVKAYFNGDTVSSDFHSINFLIMLFYLVASSVFFFVGIWSEKKRTDLLIMGWISWVALLVMFRFAGIYMKVFCMPFLAG